MSWFKKIFGSQYGFRSSQEPKVSYVKEKTEIDGDKIEDLTINKIQKCNDTTQDDNKSDDEKEKKKMKKLVFT